MIILTLGSIFLIVSLLYAMIMFNLKRSIPVALFLFDHQRSPAFSCPAFLGFMDDLLSFMTPDSQ